MDKVEHFYKKNWTIIPRETKNLPLKTKMLTLIPKKLSNFHLKNRNFDLKKKSKLPQWSASISIQPKGLAVHFSAKKIDLIDATTFENFLITAFHTWRPVKYSSGQNYQLTACMFHMIIANTIGKWRFFTY